MRMNLLSARVTVDCRLISRQREGTSRRAGGGGGEDQGERGESASVAEAAPPRRGA